MECYASIKKEWNLAICDSMDEPGEYYAKWNKSDRGQMSYICDKFTYKWNLKANQISIIETHIHVSPCSLQHHPQQSGHGGIMFYDSSLGLSWVTHQQLVLILEAGQFVEHQWAESCFSENQHVWLAFPLPTKIHHILSQRSLQRTGRRGRETMRKRRWCEVDEPHSGDLAQVQIITDCENLGKSFYLLELHSLRTTLSSSVTWAW